MHRIVLLIIAFAVAAGICRAQRATVERVEATPFEVIPAADRRTDLNGDPCALVRVEVLADDAIFEGNVIGPVEHSSGQYRVFLSPGTKMLRIRSGAFLPLMITFPDYGISGVQPNAVYAITLSLPQAPAAPQSASAGMNYLILNVSPSTATVTVDGKPCEVRNGAAKILLRSGASYLYRVEAGGYIPEEGQIAIGGEKVERSITLRSLKGSLTVNTITPGTEIYVNGERMGAGSWTGTLLAGNYLIEGRIDGYQSVSENIDITTGDNSTVTLPALRSLKGALTVNSTTPGTEIYVNGERMGAGSWRGDVLPGNYLVEGRLASYRNAEQLVSLETGDAKTVTLPALQPITGSLNVDYEPMGAAITIDGTPRGATPAIIDNLLIGPHTVTISADGYTPASLTATVTDAQLTPLTGVLPRQALTNIEKVNYKPFKIKKSGKWGFKGKKGKVMIPAKFDWASEFTEGLAGVKLNGKWGYIDKTGEFVIPAKFDFALGFSEGLARVELNGKWGFIDKTGEFVIPAKFDYAWSFQNGKAEVKLNGRWFDIDKQGNEVK